MRSPLTFGRIWYLITVFFAIASSIVPGVDETKLLILILIILVWGATETFAMLIKQNTDVAAQLSPIPSSTLLTRRVLLTYTGFIPDKETNGLSFSKEVQKRGIMCGVPAWNSGFTPPEATYIITYAPNQESNLPTFLAQAASECGFTQHTLFPAEQH